LNGRTFDISIAAKNAAVSGFGLKKSVAIFTFVKKLTGILRHGFFLLETAIRAGKCGGKNDIHLGF